MLTFIEICIQVSYQESMTTQRLFWNKNCVVCYVTSHCLISQNIDWVIRAGKTIKLVHCWNRLTLKFNWISINFLFLANDPEPFIQPCVTVCFGNILWMVSRNQKMYTMQGLAMLWRDQNAFTCAIPGRRECFSLELLTVLLTKEWYCIRMARIEISP